MFTLGISRSWRLAAARTWNRILIGRVQAALVEFEKGADLGCKATKATEVDLQNPIDFA
jgi:hypothetical protein